MNRGIQRRGFTIFELLVVVAIMILLAAVIIPNLVGMRDTARDTERVTDVKRIQIAVEEYFDINANYPSNMDELVTEGVLRTKPEDPLNRGDYVYSYAENACGGGDGANYSISFTAEKPSTFEGSSSDVIQVDGNTFCVEG